MKRAQGTVKVDELLEKCGKFAAIGVVTLRGACFSIRSSKNLERREKQKKEEGVFSRYYSHKMQWLCPLCSEMENIDKYTKNVHPPNHQRKGN